jgi:voltage-gated potassium channel
MLRSQRDPLVQMLGHTTVVLVLLTIAYFVVPLRIDWTHGTDVSRLLASLAALVALALLVRRWLRRSRQVLDMRYVRIEWLLSCLYVLVLTFALVYAALTSHDPGQFVGLEDRTDALYFSVTVVGTVGFGDIHAQGGAARLLVTAHMLFNLIYLGTALRLLTSPRPDAPSARSEAD